MRKKILVKIKKIKPIHYLVIFFVIVIYLGAMIGIINYQNTHKIANPPKLEITVPKNGDILSPGDFTVQGVSDPKAEISVNETKMTADKKGNFSLSTPIVKSQDNIKVIAQKNGLISEQSVAISVFVPETVKKAPAQTKKKSTVKSLNNTGPETLWVFEIGALSAAGAAWQTSRKKLRQSFRA